MKNLAERPAFRAVFAAIAACAVLAVCLLSGRAPEPARPGEKTPLTERQLALREKYPELFELDASEGLVIFASVFSDTSCRCALLPGSTRQVAWELSFGMKHGMLPPEDVLEIIDAYGLPDRMIRLYAVQNPISSISFSEDGRERLTRKTFAGRFECSVPEEVSGDGTGFRL